MRSEMARHYRQLGYLTHFTIYYKLFINTISIWNVVKNCNIILI